MTESADPRLEAVIFNIEITHGVDITQSLVFSGDYDPITGEGTIAGGDFNVCTVQNEFTATTLPPGGHLSSR